MLLLSLGWGHRPRFRGTVTSVELKQLSLGGVGVKTEEKGWRVERETASALAVFWIGTLKNEAGPIDVLKFLVPVFGLKYGFLCDYFLFVLFGNCGISINNNNKKPQPTNQKTPPKPNKNPQNKSYRQYSNIFCLIWVIFRLSCGLLQNLPWWCWWFQQILKLADSRYAFIHL